jgi:hypothetical protein
MDMRIAMTLPGAGQLSLLGNGKMDLAAGRGTLSMRSAEPLPGLASGLRLDEVIDRKVLYLRVRGLPAGLLHGKSWARIDLDKLASSAGLDLGALQSAGSSNPTDTMRWLNAAGDVKKLGSATIRGTRTDHYSAVIDLTKVVAKLPASQREAARNQIAQLRQLGAPRRLPTEVWVGDDGLLRRQALTIRQALPGGAGRMTMRMVVDLHDYGIAVRVHRPDPSDVYDVTGEAQSALRKRSTQW